MTEVLSSSVTSSSSTSPGAIFLHEDPNINMTTTSTLASLSPTPRTQPRDRVPSYAQNRMSHYSQRSSRSRPHSHVFPAFASSLPYALVRDFAYPVFHPMHYGAELEPSGPSTPNSDWSSSRRQSDPMEQWNTTASGSHGGWSAGPWGGDGVMHGEPRRFDDEGENLPSTSFGSESGPSSFDLATDDDVGFRRRHRKSKSYTSISDYERGRRRESGRGRDASDGSGGVFIFHGQQGDLAGRDSLRMSRGYSGIGVENGGARRDSPLASTLPTTSFHNNDPTATNHSRTSQQHLSTNEPFDPDDHIPLDTEPHASTSPIRDSLGPEDEDLFAGPSLALYSFEPENSNELRLIEGQEILVSYRHGQGWLVASDPRTGEQGLVPEAYVRLIADIPGYDPETGQFVDVDGVEIDEEGEHNGAMADRVGRDEAMGEDQEEEDDDDDDEDEDEDDDDEEDESGDLNASHGKAARMGNVQKPGHER